MSENKKKWGTVVLGKGQEITVFPSDYVWVTALGTLFIVCLELFYRMIVNYNGKYNSDMEYYVVTKNVEKLVPERLLDYIFRFLYEINETTMEINIFLALEIVAIVIVNYLVIRYFLKEDGFINTVPRYAIQFFSLSALFTGPIYFPIIHEWFYRHSFSSFAWHSPTQQAMTLFAMISSLCFLKMYLKYENEVVSTNWWIATSVTTFLATMAKPSYTINLVLTIVVMFIVDLIANGRQDFWNNLLKLFLMGLSIVPSGLYMIWLHTLEFTEGTQFNEEHKITIGISNLLNNDHLLISIIFGMAFPIVVFAIAPHKLKNSGYRFAFYIFIMGVVQWGFLYETGTRGAFGNFNWGKIYGTYFITLIASVVTLEMIYDKDGEFDNNRMRKMNLILIGIVFIASVVSQLVYFVQLVTGHGYWR